MVLYTFGQVGDLVRQALDLVRGNLAADVLADQACTFLGSVDGQGRPAGQGAAKTMSAQLEDRNDYRGDFEAGLRHGIGEVKFGDGTAYQGEWVLDHPKGYGVEVYPDGGVYKGRFWNDARHGFGAYYFANGQRYFGRWNTGVRHGEGVEMGRGGEKFYSVFEMGKRVSKVDLRDEKAKGMEVLTQVDAAAQIGERRSEQAQDVAAKLFVLSKILHTTHHRDMSVDGLMDIIAKIRQDRGLSSTSPESKHRTEWASLPQDDVESAGVEEHPLLVQTAELGDASSQARKVQFDFDGEPGSAKKTSRPATNRSDTGTAAGTVPVEWVSRPDGGGIMAHRFREKGVLNDTGIMVGDILAEVDGQSVQKFTYHDAMAVLNGPVGSDVRLTILRNGEPIRLMVQRKPASVLRPVSAASSLRLNSSSSNRSEAMKFNEKFEAAHRDELESSDQPSRVSTAVLAPDKIGSIRWSQTLTPRRLAGTQQKLKDIEERRIIAIEAQRLEAEEVARQEEEEAQHRAQVEARERADAENRRKEAEARAQVQRLEEERAAAVKIAEARALAEANVALQEEEAARRAAQEKLAEEQKNAEEEAKRISARKHEQEREIAARRLAEEERLQAEMAAIERAKEERMERDRIKREEDIIKADAALAAGLKAARCLDVASAKRLLDEAVQITKRASISDRKDKIQELRVDTEFAQIKIDEQKVEEKIAQARVILQREVSSVDGRKFCQDDIAEARNAVKNARSVCADMTFYLEQLEIITSDIDRAERRLVAVDDVKEDRAVSAVGEANGVAANKQSTATPSPDCEKLNEVGEIASRSADSFIQHLVTDLVDSAAVDSVLGVDTDGSDPDTPQKKTSAVENTLENKTEHSIPGSKGVAGTPLPDDCKAAVDAETARRVEDAEIWAEIEREEELNARTAAEAKAEQQKMACEKAEEGEEERKRADATKEASEKLVADEAERVRQEAERAKENEEERERARLADEAKQKPEVDEAMPEQLVAEKSQEERKDADVPGDHVTTKDNIPGLMKESSAALAAGALPDAEAAGEVEDIQIVPVYIAHDEWADDTAMSQHREIPFSKGEPADSGEPYAKPAAPEETGSDGEIEFSAAPAQQLLAGGQEDASSDHGVQGSDSAIDKLLVMAEDQEAALQEHLQEKEASRLAALEAEIRKRVQEEERDKVSAILASDGGDSSTAALLAQIQQQEVEKAGLAAQITEIRALWTTNEESIKEQTLRQVQETMSKAKADQQILVDEVAGFRKRLEDLEEQNRKLAQEKAAVEENLEQIKQAERRRALQDSLAVDAKRSELPTSIEEEKIRKMQRLEMEASAAEMRRVEDEKAAAKRLAQEEEQRAIEEERRNLLMELEREKQAALDRAVAAESEMARLAAMVEEGRAEHVRNEKAHIVGEAEEADFAQQVCLEEETVPAEEAKIALTGQTEESRNAEEAQIELEKRLAEEREIEQVADDSHIAQEQSSPTAEATVAAASADEAEIEAGMDAEEGRHIVEPKEQHARHEETEGEGRGTQEDEPEVHHAEVAGLDTEFARLSNSVDATDADENMCDDERLKSAPSSAMSGPENRLDSRPSLILKPEVQSLEDMENESGMFGAKAQAKHVQIEFVLGMNFSEIIGMEKEFEAELVQELCSAVSVRTERMQVVQLSAGSIVSRININEPAIPQGGHEVLAEDPELGPEDSAEEVALELLRQMDDDQSALRQGKYGSKATSLTILREDETQDRDGLLQKTSEGEHWKVLEDAGLDEEVVGIIPQSDKPPEENTAFQPAEEISNLVEHPKASPPVPISCFTSLVNVALQHKKAEVQEAYQAPPVTVRRCRGTLLSISSDWSQAWAGTKRLLSADDTDEDHDLSDLQESWLGGCMTSNRHRNNDELDGTESDFISVDSSPTTRRHQKKPDFRPARKIEDWRSGDVMPMCKAALAMRHEGRQPSTINFQLSRDDLPEVNGFGPQDVDPFDSHCPPEYKPPKAPAFNPAPPLAPGKKNPYMIPAINDKPLVSPLTRRTMQQPGALAPKGPSEPELAKSEDEMLSTEAQMELGELLEEVLSAELGQDCFVPAPSVTVESNRFADAPQDATSSLSAELGRWKPHRKQIEPDVLVEPAEGSGNVPELDVDAAGVDLSGTARLSWVPGFHARAWALSKEHSRAFLDALSVNDSSYNEVGFSPPEPGSLKMPAIVHPPKTEFKVGDASKKKWEGWAAMSDHERHARFKRQAELGMRKGKGR